MRRGSIHLRYIQDFYPIQIANFAQQVSPGMLFDMVLVFFAVVLTIFALYKFSPAFPGVIKS